MTYDHIPRQPPVMATAKKEKRDFASGVTSTKQPRLSLIPHNGLVNAAKRFELGLERHREKSYNNLSGNSKAALTDRDWLIERCSHAIEHCYRMIDYLKGMEFGEELDAALGDAGAVAWCGLVLGEALHGRQKAGEVQAECASNDTGQSSL